MQIRIIKVGSLQTNCYILVKDGNCIIIDPGDQFYSIVKTLGAFSKDGNGQVNYYEEWNNDRYRSHINAVSLIRNDNLAFAEQDGKLHIKLGFYDFDYTLKICLCK